MLIIACVLYCHETVFTDCAVILFVPAVLYNLSRAQDLALQKEKLTSWITTARGSMCFPNSCCVYSIVYDGTYSILKVQGREQPPKSTKAFLLGSL